MRRQADASGADRAAVGDERGCEGRVGVGAVAGLMSILETHEIVIPEFTTLL